MASEKGRFGVVRALLHAGANKEVKDRVGGGFGYDHSCELPIRWWFLFSPLGCCITLVKAEWGKWLSRESGAEGVSGAQSLRSRICLISTLPAYADRQHTPHGGQQFWPSRSGAGPVGCGC